MEVGEVKESFVDIFDIDFTKYEGTQNVEKKEEDLLENESGKVEDVTGKEAKVDQPDTTRIDNKKVDVTIKEAETEDNKPTNLPSTPNIEELVLKLADKGVLSFDEQKEYDLSTIEGLEELVSENNVITKKKTIDEYESSLGDEGKELLTILKNGGSVSDYISQKEQIDFSKVPVQDADGNPIVGNQINLISDLMKTQGYNDEEIQEKIEDLNKTGLLEKEATIAKRKLADWQVKQNEEKVKQLQITNKQREEQSAKEADDFKKTVLGLEEVAGFKLDKTQAEKLYDYITKPIDKEGNTQFKKDDTTENRLLYAYFAMIGFDKEQLSKEVRTKTAINLKRNLANYKDANASTKAGDYTKRAEQQDKVLKDIPWMGM